MPTEHIVDFYEPQGEETEFEWSSDGYTWVPISHYDVRSTSDCKEARISVESGWVRGKNLLSNPELYGNQFSNIIALPEPGGLLAGVICLMLLWSTRAR